MSDLFISYSRDDRTFVEKLHAAVKDSGRDAWLDKFDIEKGEKFWREIEQGIDGANAFVFVVSPTSIKKAAGEKEYCRREIEYAVRQGKRIIPIVLRDLFEPSERVERWLDQEVLAHQELVERNWLKFDEREFELCLTELLETVEKDVDYVKLHTQLLEDARGWINEGRKDSNLLRGELLSKAETWFQHGIEKMQLQSKEPWRKHRDPEPTEEQQNFIKESRAAEDARLERETLTAKAQAKARKTIQVGAGVLAISIFGAGIAGLSAMTAIKTKEKAQEVQKEAQEGTRLERDSTDVLEQFKESQMEGLLRAVRAASELKKIVKDGRPLIQYPTVTPIFTLQKILGQVQEVRIQGSKPKMHPSGKFLATLSGNHRSIELSNLQGKKLVALQAYSLEIEDYYFSRNGEFIIVSLAGAPKTIVWHLPSKEEEFSKISHLEQKELPGKDVALNSYGDSFSTYEEWGGIKIWNLTGEEIGRIKIDRGSVVKGSIKFTSNGKFIIAKLSSEASNVAPKDVVQKIWDLSGKEIRSISDEGIGELISKDAGKIIAYDGTKLWDFSGKQASSLPLDSQGGSLFFASPNNEFFVITSITKAHSGTEGPVATVWNWKGEKITTLNVGQTSVSNVVFSDDSKKFATISFDGSIKIWNLKGEEISTLSGDTPEPEGGQLPKVAFSTTSDKIAVANHDGVVHLYDSQGKEINSSKILPRSSSISFISGDSKLLVSDQLTVAIWSFGEENSTLLSPQNGRISQIEYSPDGKSIATINQGEKSVKLLMLDGQKIAELEGDIMLFSPDGKMLATNGIDGEIQIWSFAEQKLIKFRAHQNEVHQLTFSPDSKFLAIYSFKDATIMWDISINPPKKMNTVGEAGKINRGIAFSPSDGRLLIEDRSGISLWNLKGQLINELIDDSTINSVNASLDNLLMGPDTTFSPDGQKIAGPAHDGTMKLWSSSGQEILKFPEYTPTSIAFSPDGQRLATIGADGGEITIWDLSGQKINRIRSKKKYLKNLAFSRDGQMLAAGGSDSFSQTSPRSFQMWDLSGRLVGQFDSNNLFSGTRTISPDWKSVATIVQKPGEPNQSIKIWQIGNLDELIQRGCENLKVLLLNNPDSKEDREMCGMK